MDQEEWLIASIQERVTVNKSDDGDILFYDCIVEDITEHVIIEKLIRDLHVGDYSILKLCRISFSSYQIPVFLLITKTATIIIFFLIRTN